VREGEGSSTALGVSVIRTVHQVLDDSPHILEDPISALLLDDARIERMLRQPEAHRSRAARGLRSHIVLRSRYAEDEMHDATVRGVTQCMNLGAGYDTFAYRQPKGAANLQLVELDHPVTQKEKRSHFATRGLKDPDNLAFAAADLENDPFGKVLGNSPMDLRLPIWISCLGVFAYLRKQTVHGIFEAVSGLAKGSGIVFAFAPDEELTNVAPEAPASVADRAAELGEPWLTRFAMENLKIELEGCGFSEVRFLEPWDAAARYYGNRNDLPAPRIARLCKAIV
jgi:methyltransferase (TIGR00027 family)